MKEETIYIPAPVVAGAADDPVGQGCSCHQHPPCSWCVEGGDGYEIFRVARDKNGSWALAINIKDTSHITADSIIDAAELADWCWRQNALET